MTVEEAYRLGGWNRIPGARVWALASNGPYACAISGVDDQRRELATDYWTHGTGGWTCIGGIGGSFHTDGVVQWSVGRRHFSAPHQFSEDDPLPEDAATQVGNMTLTWTEDPLTVMEIVQELLDRGAGPEEPLLLAEFRAEAKLALLLAANDEDTLALSSLVGSLVRYAVPLYRAELADIAVEAERRGLVAHEWATLPAHLLD